MSSLPSRNQQRAESVFINILSTALWELAFRGVPTLMTWYVAHQASIRGWALPWIVVAGSVVFLALSVGLHFLLDRWRKPKESQTAIVTCPDKQLHELAEGQQKDIDAWIYCDTCSLGPHDLLRPSPYIDFRFTILNSSVFIVSLGSLSGVVSFANTPLDGKIDWIKPPPDNIYPGAGRPSLENYCVARLTLNDTQDVARVLNIRSGFGFGHLAAKIASAQTGSRSVGSLISKRGLLIGEMIQ